MKLMAISIIIALTIPTICLAQDATLNSQDVRGATVLLTCPTEHSTDDRATGVFINKDTIVTAAHAVEDAQGCKLNGHNLRVGSVDIPNDVAVLHTYEADPNQPSMQVSCNGYNRNGEEYTAYGYHEGEYRERHVTSTNQDVVVKPDSAYSKQINSLPLLRGNTEAGMSGGPVVDKHGNVVGILNAGNGEVVGSREFRGTLICR